MEKAGEMKHLTGRLDLNRAGEDELACVPVIGAEAARKIVKYRQEHGAFDTLESLAQAGGLDQAALEQLRSALSVEGRLEAFAAPQADKADDKAHGGD